MNKLLGQQAEEEKKDKKAVDEEIADSKKVSDMKKEPTVDSDASTAADEFHAEDSIDNIGKEQADLADSVKGLNTELSDAIKSATVKD